LNDAFALHPTLERTQCRCWTGSWQVSD